VSSTLLSLPVPATNAKLPDRIEERVRILADSAPNQEGYEIGIRLAVQTLLSSEDPERALLTMERNIPAWFAAMTAGKARLKPLRFLIADKDWLRPAPTLRNARPAMSNFERALAEVAEEIG
jgi:hypothetical protein